MAASSRGWSGVVLYNVDKDSERGQRLMEVLSSLCIEMRTVEPADLNTAVGAIVGLPGFGRAKEPFAGAAPNCEFMLICNLGDTQMRALLTAMKNADARVALKAALTPTNRFWSVAKLIEEVSAEHKAMTGGK